MKQKSNRFDRRVAVAVAAVLGGVIVANRADATAYEWDLNASGNWDTATNWNPDGVPDGGGPFDNATLAGTANYTVHTNSADRTIAGMTFSNTGTTDLVGGSALGTPTTTQALLRTRGGFTFNAGIGTVNIGTDTVTQGNNNNRLRVELTSHYTFTNNSSNPVNFWQTTSGPGDSVAPGTELRSVTLDGTGLLGAFKGGINSSSNSLFAVIKNGSGTWQLNDNSYAGGTTLNAGHILMGSSNAFSNSTASPFPLESDKRVTINGGGFSGIGASARTIPTIIPVFVAGDFSISTDPLATQRANIGGTVDLTGGNRTITVGTQGSEFRGIVSNGSITKAGTGNLILQAANTLGAIAVNEGSVTAQHLSALGDATSGTTVASGGELGFNGVAVNGVIAEPLTIVGPGPGDTSSGALTIENNANVNITSNISITGDTTIHTTGTGTANLSGGVTATGNHNLTLRGGSGVGGGTASGAISLGTGSITKSQTGTWTLSAVNSYSGGTTVNGGTLRIANADALGTGGLTVTDATAQVQLGLPKAVSVDNVTLTGTGKLDMTDNDLVIKTSTLAAVQAQVTAGFNGGTWDGAGINSSSAATHPNATTALGYGDNAELGLTTFSGVALTGPEILVKYTYYGDADLTGVVDLDDFGLFLTGYQNGSLPRTWIYGDFDYTGVIDLDDFGLFLYGYQNQGGPLSALSEAVADASGISSSDRASMQSAISAVPEPASLGVLGLAAVGLLGRRRRTARQANA